MVERMQYSITGPQRFRLRDHTYEIPSVQMFEFSLVFPFQSRWNDHDQLFESGTETAYHPFTHVPSGGVVSIEDIQQRFRSADSLRLHSTTRSPTEDHRR